MILENYVSVNSENESFEENIKQKNKQLTFYYISVYALEKDITEEKISTKSAFRERRNKHMNLLEATICSVFVVFLRTFM